MYIVRTGSVTQLTLVIRCELILSKNIFNSDLMSNITSKCINEDWQIQ